MFIKLREKKAFTLVEIMIVVAIIGLLIAIALPNFVKARNTTRFNLCRNNLRLVGHAAEEYIIDNNLLATALVTNVQAADYCKGGIPRCPAGGVYTIGTETVATDSGPTVICTGANHPPTVIDPAFPDVKTGDPITYHVLTGKVT